jgi:sec-independent protein translocase protein TatC
MARNTEREMELWEHLAELRSRIFRALFYAAFGMAICWAFYDELRLFLEQPLRNVLGANFKTMYTTAWQPFMVQVQISLVAGLILALPLITLELWGFVAPGLTREEKKGFHVVVPLSLFFFLTGVTTAYLVLPSAFSWFVGFLRPDDTLLNNPLQYVVFVVKMLLAFGLVFQLPVVLMFLAWIGVVSSQMLKENWRSALVLSSVVAAVATPSNDAFTMLLMALPLTLLYFASIWLVAMVERTRARHALQESTGMGTP